MILTTSATIPGHTITEWKGLVKGNTIRARHVGKDIMAGLRTLIGGEIKEYTAMMAQSREESLLRMIEEAQELGANAVTDVRFTTSMVMSNTSEILAFGTAVVAVKG
ncbi:MAG: YbjQ family protein [Candidatus Marinimicrobia bacterium]|jgi:uncharacterized protein YbjQ (UPF0145 family)|nr:hypothetical protein [Candidatus Neomarinimicrobiota bacterium]MDP6593630.1 YbjQ family protein [Candidatus Neomarinimicrobiota bacterium]MDP6836625.1 YbjQ family protein [Candidatus Neomarinimicrobiota bacterium]MDP6966043.1 YbjQ family protein [Candidatus Neomarinimicrobiota bacterium]|tara:strand:- start:7255 stop:7575 length:321 start_codon:yes stop_codon:yes gene_type:complete